MLIIFFARVELIQGTWVSLPAPCPGKGPDRTQEASGPGLRLKGAFDNALSLNYVPSARVSILQDSPHL